MARISVDVDRAQLLREVDALIRRAQASAAVRSQLEALSTLGVSQVEMVTVPARRGRLKVRVQLSDAYWRILEREAV